LGASLRAKSLCVTGLSDRSSISEAGTSPVSFPMPRSRR